MSDVRPKPDDDILLRAWLVTLRSEGYPASTQCSYLKAARAFQRWLCRPLDTATRADIRGFITDMQDRKLAISTISNRVAVLKAFYNWATTEGDIPKNPTAGIRVAMPPTRVTQLLTLPELQQLLKVRRGSDFLAVRDRAIIMVLADTGVRISELLDMRLAEIDVVAGTIVVRGKGANRQGPRVRVVAMGDKTSLAVARYIRLRSTRPGADLPHLWLSLRARPLSANTLRVMLRKAGKQAGITKPVHPHAFRHLFAHEFRNAGGNDTDLMTLGGWSNQQLIAKLYGNAAAEQRAHQAAKKFSLGDRI